MPSNKNATESRPPAAPDGVHMDVAVDLPVYQPFTYLVPPALVDFAVPGKRVLVPFGNRRVTGYLLESADPPEKQAAKRILDILDEAPLFPAGMLLFFLLLYHLSVFLPFLSFFHFFLLSFRLLPPLPPICLSSFPLLLPSLFTSLSPPSTSSTYLSFFISSPFPISFLLPFRLLPALPPICLSFFPLLLPFLFTSLSPPSSSSTYPSFFLSSPSSISIYFPFASFLFLHLPVFLRFLSFFHLCLLPFRHLPPLPPICLSSFPSLSGTLFYPRH